MKLLSFHINTYTVRSLGNIELCFMSHITVTSYSSFRLVSSLLKFETLSCHVVISLCHITLSFIFVMSHTLSCYIVVLGHISPFIHSLSCSLSCPFTLFAIVSSTAEALTNWQVPSIFRRCSSSCFWPENKEPLELHSSTSYW